MAVITQRRICWPDPDATCLNGGCNHCNRYPFRKLTEIERWAKQAPPVNQRYKRTQESAWKAYMWGLGNEFVNADTK